MTHTANVAERVREGTDMSELLAAALRMMTARGRAPKDDVFDGVPTLPTALAYAEYVRRFDPDAVPPTTVTRVSAVARLVRIHRTLDTLHGLARARGARAGSFDSEHLYQTHGEPRD